jgi:hypothetical protein
MSDSKHLTHFQQSHQRKSESVLAWSPCTIQGQTSGIPTGVLIVTNERVVFCRKAWFGGERVQSIERRNVSSVDRTTSFGTQYVSLRTSSAETRCMLRGTKEQVQGLFDALDAHSQSQPAAR